MKIWGKYTSLVYWRYWVELPFMCKSIVEAWNWKCSHNKWTSQLNVGDFKNINDGLIYRNISWLFPKKEILSFIFLDLLSGALADLLHLILPIIPFIWLTRSHALLLWNKSLMKYILLAQDLHGLVWSSFLATRYSPLLSPGSVVHPEEFGSHSFCPRALFLPAPCQYFSINASEQMSIFLLLNLYLLLASISGKVQEYIHFMIWIAHWKWWLSRLPRTLE